MEVTKSKEPTQGAKEGQKPEIDPGDYLRVPCKASFDGMGGWPLKLKY
jgi:hypothetical protein